MGHYRIATIWVVGVMWGVAAAQAAAAPPDGSSEPAVVQAERLRILQTELAAEHQRVDVETRRHAERLAVHDAVGADEAAQARQRGLEAVSGLQREIAFVGQQPAPLASTPPGPASVTVSARRVTAGDSPPWWDVYAHRARPARPQNSSLDVPPREPPRASPPTPPRPSAAPSE